MRSAPAIAGLLIAWGGTALLAGPAVRLAPRSPLAKGVLDQMALWALCAVVLGIVVWWEHEPLASLWLKPWQWQSLVWAAVLTLASITVVFPATEWVRRAAGLSGYAKGMEAVLVYPGWLRIVAVITAGVVEETLFRGFAVTRILALSGSLWLAVGLSSVVFAALHVSHWGVGPSVAFFVGGVATTVFFVWCQDLVAMILAHIAIDMWALVITPSRARWWE